MTGQPFVHPAPAKRQLGDGDFAGTQRDTLQSFIITSGELVEAKRERDKALATIGRVQALHIIDCPSANNVRQWCASDKMLWPCPTIRALKEPS